MIPAHRRKRLICVSSYMPDDAERFSGCGSRSLGLHGRVDIHSTEYNGVLGMISIILFCIDTFGIPYLNWAVLLGHELWEVFDMQDKRHGYIGVIYIQSRFVLGCFILRLTTNNSIVFIFCACLRSTSAVLLEVKMARLDRWLLISTDANPIKA